ncbi:MAG: right-handed parallel beta-helix repeat-containing protein [Planctomycetota bacterium]|jgi:parallel beta-helix repeat protein
MNRQAIILLTSSIGCALGLAIGLQSGNAQPGPGGLPGARPEIDASRFPTLQAALDAIPEEGGLVRLPAGTFEITQPLVLRRGDVVIQGAGAATHIVNTNEDGQPALLVQHADEGKVKKEDRLWRVMLSNFRITGNEKSGHGILAHLIEEIFIQGVTVSYHGGDGIRLDHCYEDPRVSDCLITYNKAVGLNLLGCHDIVVAANQFEENQDAVHCIDGFNLCMTGCCVDDHLGAGVVIENTYGSVVSGNMIEECNAEALIMDRDCYGNTVSANVIAHNGGGVDLRDAHGCAISANTFTIMKTNAVRIGPDSGRITVTGNNFSNSNIGGGVKRGTNDLAAAGMTIESAEDLVVTGNVFASVEPKAVELKGDSSSRVIFSSNLLKDVASDHESLKDSVVSDVLSAD